MNKKLLMMIISTGILSFLFVGIIGYLALDKLNVSINKLHSIQENESRMLFLSEESEINLLKMQRAEKNMIATQDDAEADMHKKSFLKNKEQLELYLIELKSLLHTNSLEIKVFETNYDKYISNYEKIVELRSKSLTQEAFALSSNESRQYVDNAFGAMEKILASSQLSIDEAVATADKNYLDFSSLINELSFSLILILALAYIFITLFITKRLKSIENLINYIKLGDFTKTIEQSKMKENDELASIQKSVYDAILLLQENTDIKDKAEWVLNSALELARSVNEEQTLLNVTEVAIAGICRKINAAMGVLYIYNLIDDTLTLSSSYSYKNHQKSSLKVKLGEGVIGQVAKEKKEIFLTNMSNDFTPVTTGTVEKQPSTILAYPLIFKNQLVGVFEVASFELIDANQKIYLDTLRISLSSAIYGAKLADEAKNLLKTTQQQALKLEESQQQLQQQNKELEEQRQQLEEQTRTLEQSQQELEIHNSELVQVRQEVEQRSRELEESSRYKSEFLANMSHELRTPLNSINILSKILSDNKEHTLTPKQSEQALTIYRSGKDLLQLINDILDLSKIEAKMMSLHLGDVHLKALAQELFSMFEPLAAEKKVKFTFTADELQESILYTDKEKIKQILKNFLSNALKFTDSEGTISLSVSNTEDNAALPVVFSIHDTGIGIPQDKIKTVFEAFRQVDGSTSRKYGGTGLGLSISQELSNLLGGKIIVESIYGEGSTFSLLLPQVLDTKEIDAELIDIIGMNDYDHPVVVKQVKYTSHNLEDDRNKIHQGDNIVLIIEDDINFAKIVQEEARRQNLKTILSTNGQEGLELALMYKPSGIILDMNLPVMDGWDVLKLLKADTKTRHIPVKIISFDEPNIIAKRMGAINYIQKPLEPEELDKALKTLILTSNKDKKDLLIVEDNETLRTNLVEILTADDIYIAQASDAKTAMTHVKEREFDCAIVDIGLPDMDGFELLEKIKRHNCDLPIIVYSGRDFTAEELKVLREYSDSVILKTAESEARLVDETALFLHRLHKNLTHSQKKLLNSSFESEGIFNEKKVLVVDDDIRNVFSLDALLSDKGMITVPAYNGEEALEELQKNPDIDIILMDIMMPIMNGYEAIAAIRNNPNFTKTPIITLTAKAQKEDRQKCLDAGANDYMSKPIDNEQLLQLMKIWMKRV